jgi:hypothetical protein
MTDYEALKQFGFSAIKALEIILDASRSNEYARTVISIARKNCAA